MIAGGKEDRAMVILFLNNIQHNINLLFKIRGKIKPNENKYLFAYQMLKISG